MISQNHNTIFNFKENLNLYGWKIVTDSVMGGLSKSTMTLNNENIGMFQGEVSLENNGGFAAVKYNFNKLNVSSFSKISFTVKSDPKKYQLRLKVNKSDQQSYVSYFETNGNWQTITLNLNEFYPTFRGRKLHMPNFSSETIEEIGILIGNKTAEKFNLLINSIYLE
jgi:hypothetical protein